MAYKISLFLSKHIKFISLSIFVINVAIYFVPAIYFDFGEYGETRNYFFFHFKYLVNVDSINTTSKFLIEYVFFCVMVITNLLLSIIGLKKKNLLLFSMSFLPLIDFDLRIMIQYSLNSIISAIPHVSFFASIIVSALCLTFFIVNMNYEKHPLSHKPSKPPKQKPLTDKERIAQLEQEVNALKDKADQ